MRFPDILTITPKFIPDFDHWGQTSQIRLASSGGSIQLHPRVALSCERPTSSNFRTLLGPRERGIPRWVAESDLISSRRQQSGFSVRGCRTCFARVTRSLHRPHAKLDPNRSRMPRAAGKHIAVYLKHRARGSLCCEPTRPGVETDACPLGLVSAPSQRHREHCHRRISRRRYLGIQGDRRVRE